MSTIQSDCEAEIVPSLHSKRGDMSVASAGFDATAGSGAVEVRAVGLCDRAQPVHEIRISNVEAVRIAVASGRICQWWPRLTSSAPTF